jgi:hypothetical protein
LCHPPSLKPKIHLSYSAQKKKTTALFIIIIKKKEECHFGSMDEQ